MVSTSPLNYLGLSYQKEKFNGNHNKKVALGKINNLRKKDLDFVIKDSILSTKNDKNSNQSGKRNFLGNIPSKINLYLVRIESWLSATIFQEFWASNMSNL